MRKMTSVLTLMLLAATALATQHTPAPDATTGVTVIDGSWGNTTLECTVGAFDSEAIQINGDLYHAITLPGQPRLQQTGAPALPHLAVSIVIPDNAATGLQILETEFTDYPGLRPEPSKGVITRDIDPATVPWSFGPEYDTIAFPATTANLDSPYILRDFRGQVVHFQPFIWLPELNTLRVYSRIVVAVETEGRGTMNVIDRSSLPTAVDGEFLNIYRKQFINFDGREDRYTPLEEVGGLLIITTDAFHAEVEPLADWKMQKGIPTEIVDLSTIGYNSSQVMSFVQTYYNNNDLTFLLLVGDAEDLPTPYASGGSSDPSYSLLAGGDSYPDIFVGRFSGETPTQVATMVQRTIEYERDASPATWYHKGVGIASNQGPGDDGEYDNVHMDNIRADLLGYTYSEVDQIYDPSANATMVANALNNGRSIINYTGHGSSTSWSSSGFSISHINTLVNDNMLPFIQSVACVNGQFEGRTCFAEAWMRATNAGVPTGAIGIYASSINQSWNSPMCGQDEMIDLLVADEKNSYGGICFNGSMQMMDEYGDDGENMFNTWHIFGDPSIQLRTDSPAALNVTHAGSMFPTAEGYLVNCGGVAGALCSLWDDGVIYGSAVADGSGLASIPMGATPAVGTDLTLTVTAYNYQTYQGTVTVIAPEGAWVSFSDVTINDTDGELNPGETPWLIIEVLNSGVDPASDVTVTIETSDIYVSVVDGTEFYGDIEAGATAEVFNGFRITAMPTLPDGHPVQFTLTASTPARELWESGFTLLGSAPPTIEVSPASFNVMLDPDATTTEELSIANVGYGELSYSIQYSTDNDRTTVPDITLGKGEPDPRDGVLSHDRDQGGPDGYGYLWIDSDEPGGPNYSWIEISGVGTVPGSGDDGNYGPFPLGFDFDFYGVSYSAVRICTNGFISFTSTSTTYTNQGIPNSSAPNCLIAPFWDDLNPSTGGTIYYYADAANQRFIVEWDGVNHYYDSNPETFQIILNYDGTILYQYETVTTNSGCTVGIENHAGSDGLQIAFNADYLHSNMAILFTDNLADPWLEVTPTSGTVPGGNSDLLDVIFNATDLEVGVYTGSITVTSNDPSDDTIVIPVTLEVGGTPLQPVDDLEITIMGIYGNLTWSAVEGATLYRVYESDEPFGPWTLIGSTSNNNWALPLEGNKHFYQVTANN
jgi:hypothetical protein